MWQEIKNTYHLFSAILACVLYAFPTKYLTVIGVTGTDGKTTTVNLIYHILKSTNKNVSMISSVKAVINGKDYDTGFHVTTPSSWKVQAFLKKAAGELQNKKDGYMILEVTSHAIDQQRIWGVNFDVAVLTNVTHEHLDYHKTYENYVKTKIKLLQKAKIGIYNRDDRSYEVINSKYTIKNAKWLTYGIKNIADITLKEFPIKTTLVGEYNTYNILAAVAVCKQLGLTDEKIKKAIQTFRLPVGRGEIVYENSFTVMIDFAHTPNAINQLLSALRPQVKGKLIHVFGSAGKRDIKKRPAMGEAAARYADTVILTAEDPRGENVLTISQEIISGMPDKDQEKVSIIPDRQEAINKAIFLAKKGDFVVITGKGHEQSMNYGSGEVLWTDHEGVEKALRLRSV